MHRFAKNVLFLAVSMMIMLYILAAVSYIFAPYAPDYLHAMSLHRALLEAAPATFAAGFAAAVISDIALSKNDVDH